MIIDTLDNLQKYVSLNPLFPMAVDFIERHDLLNLSLGKTALKGTDLVVNVSEIPPKGKEEARVETHNRFIDIQIPLTDTETIGYLPRGECRPVEAFYDKENDITFYEGQTPRYFNLKPGMFAIFFPTDGHAPAISPKGLRKIVIKVKQ